MFTSRRTFLKYSMLAAGSAVLLRSRLTAQSNDDVHREILKKKFEFAASIDLNTKPIGEVVATMGFSFLGALYKAHTLEAPGPERLVVNLKEFDCVTFVETTLALARCIKLGATTWEEYEKQLLLIRYRHGVLNGYPSRLHYFSDWIDDNEEKGVVKNIAQELGGVPLRETINYMSVHRSAYLPLTDESTYAAVRQTEQALNARTHYYLPKEKVQLISDRILDGDIVGITTTTRGLDVAHTGFAYRLKGSLRFLHAPLTAGAIQLSKRSLADYLAQEARRTGIMIARPLSPST